MPRESRFRYVARVGEGNLKSDEQRATMRVQRPRYSRSGPLGDSSLCARKNPQEANAFPKPEVHRVRRESRRCGKARMECDSPENTQRIT